MKSNSEQSKEADAMEETFVRMYGEKKTALLVTLNAEESTTKLADKFFDIQILLTQKFSQCVNVTGLKLT